MAEIRATGRDTMGVSLMGLPTGVELVAVARAGEESAEPVEDDLTGQEVTAQGETVAAGADTASDADPGAGAEE